MAEKLYEGMFLLDSGRFAEDPEGSTKTLLGLLEKVGGTVVAHRPWQDGRLAYPIEKHRKGLHYLACFQMDSSRLTDLDRACKLSDHVIRYMVIKHPKVLFDALVESLGNEHARPTDDAASDGDRPARGQNSSDDDGDDDDSDD